MPDESFGTPENGTPDQTPESEPTFVPLTDEQLATAYHEAGHAIAALSLGRSVEKITIVRNSIRLGQVQIGKGKARRSQDFLETEAIILLSGLVSEARFTGKYAWGGAQQDLWNLRRLTLDRAGNEARAEKLEQRLLDKTEHWIDQDGHWDAIVQVVGQLQKSHSISGRAARHILETIQKKL